MAQKRLFPVLVVIVLFSMLAIYYGDLVELRAKSLALPREEHKYDGVNDLCGTCILFTPKSWTTGVLTRYQPEISARCDLLWNGDSEEVNRVKRQFRHWRNSVSDERFLTRLLNCTYVQDLLIHNFYTSQAETDFPIAFVFVIHHYPQQIVRLLRILYRPQNVYCIHVDAKVKPNVIGAFRALSQCVPNILVPKKLIAVYWSYGESVLEAQLSCFEALRSARERGKWKYVINLAGTELPLVTHRDIVEHLIALNGTTYIRSSDFPDSMRKYRFSKKYLANPRTGVPQKGNQSFGEPPYSMKLYKANAYMMMSSDFVDFLFTNAKAIALRKYMKGAECAEEHFYITLYHLPEAPVGNATVHRNVISAVWVFSNASHQTCSATVRNHLCIAGVGTMKFINSASEFFFNKYSENHDHVIMDCAEKRIVEKNKMEFAKDCSPGKALTDYHV